jgi:hypothetical protein
VRHELSISTRIDATAPLQEMSYSDPRLDELAYLAANSFTIVVHRNIVLLLAPLTKESTFSSPGRKTSFKNSGGSVVDLTVALPDATVFELSDFSVVLVGALLFSEAESSSPRALRVRLVVAAFGMLKMIRL